MNQQDRIQKLEAIIKGQPISTKKIWYNNRDTWMQVFEIPLDYLMYNPYNGRIMSQILTFERQFHPIDLNSEEDKLLVERFIWDSSLDSNKHTLSSLKLYGQNEVGIVTKDGIIIDGNRRAALLNKLNKLDDGNRKFLCVILPDELEGNRKEINALETLYQIGVDDKVDYNPVEKYLKCKELSKYFTDFEIAQMMAEDEKIIENFRTILLLMEDYLARCGYPEVYTMLSKREGHFVDLNNYLKSYTKASKNQNVDWIYEDVDLLELKTIYFDYIRLGVPVAFVRIVGRPKRADSLFCNFSIWSEFKSAHFFHIKQREELTIQEFKKVFGGEELNKVILDRDRQWIEDKSAVLMANLEDHARTLADKKISQQPFELLRRSFNSLNQVKVTDMPLELKAQADDIINAIMEKINVIRRELNDKYNK